MSRGRNSKFEWMDAFTSASIRPASAYKVGVAICNRWNGDNNHPYASVKYLVNATSLSRATVERALKVLRKEGWIAQTSRGGRRGDSTWASRWRMTIPTPQFEHPNPSLLTSQPLTSEGPVDLCLDLDQETNTGAPRTSVPQQGEGTKEPRVPDPDHVANCPWCVPGYPCIYANGATS